MIVAFATSVHDNRISISADDLKYICILNEQGVLESSLTFTTEKILSSKEVRKETNEYDLFYPNKRCDEDAA